MNLSIGKEDAADAASTVCDAQWPEWNEEYLKADAINLPVSFNGKTRFMLSVAPETSKEEIEKLALESPDAAKWIEGKTIRKIIVVPNKIINIVVG